MTIAQQKRLWKFRKNLVQKKSVIKLGNHEFRRFGQQHASPGFESTTKDVFEKVNKFLLVEDYLIYRLTGKYVTEHTLVSSTLYYNIRSMAWWDPMLQYLGITKEKLPEVFPSGAVVGTTLDFVATETGLSPSTRIVTGAYDDVASALGAGNFTEGSVSETTGTAMAMVVTLDRAIPNYVINIPMQCHAIPGKYLLFPHGQTAGFVLKWFKEQFCEGELKRHQLEWRRCIRSPNVASRNGSPWGRRPNHVTAPNGFWFSGIRH